MKPKLTRIVTQPPENFVPQRQIASFVSGLLGQQGRSAKLTQVLYRATGIQGRHVVLPDYGRQPGEYEFYANSDDGEPFPNLEKRMEVFKKEGLRLSTLGVKRMLEDRGLKPSDITHFMVVSCTGLYAPGIDIEIIDEVGFKKNINRLGINFMGCYAVFNALRTAKSICQSEPNAKVMIVSIEFTSLHFQKEDTLGHLLSTALFGDGLAVALVENSDEPGLELGASYGEVFKEAHDHLLWELGVHGFKIQITDKIPDLVRQSIGQMKPSLEAALGTASEEFDLYAIHPGGRAILDVMEESLGITREQNAIAHEVMKSNGNMSSATILYVLDLLMNQLTPANTGQKVLGFGFGPGLTIESMEFTYR